MEKSDAKEADHHPRPDSAQLWHLRIQQVWNARHYDQRRTGSAYPGEKGNVEAGRGYESEGSVQPLVRFAQGALAIAGAPLCGPG